jgi:hypothetical protein
MAFLVRGEVEDWLRFDFVFFLPETKVVRWVVGVFDAGDQDALELMAVTNQWSEHILGENIAIE